MAIHMSVIVALTMLVKRSVDHSGRNRAGDMIPRHTERKAVTTS